MQDFIHLEKLSFMKNIVQYTIVNCSKFLDTIDFQRNTIVYI